MILSDISITRPVFASVMSLLLIIFGLLAFDRLSVREYPDVDPPIISIETTYHGASAAVIETSITQIIENSVAGVEGIKYIASRSRDGQSDITIEFNLNRDIEAAVNDIRDKVATIVRTLPDEADPPVIQKIDVNEQPIIWFNLVSDTMDLMELSDYVRRHIEDRFSSIDGVARIRVGSRLDYSMRIWLDRMALAARNLTAYDVEDALRTENVELPAGNIESIERQFTVRVQRSYQLPNDFANLVLAQGDDGYLVRLGDVARIEIGPEQPRVTFRRNGIPVIGIGIIKQSTANSLDVARAARIEADKIDQSLPNGTQLILAYDSTIFIEKAIHEVYQTLFITVLLVLLVIYLFLGNLRALIIPALTIPISLIATFIILYTLGFSINLLTLLALVLSIGLVVDDTIVVLENICRRLESGETPLVAAYKGTRQVSFAVIATTLVLVAVFLPIAFLPGELGRLFTEFALTVSAAVTFSSFVSLTLSPMLASKLLAKQQQTGKFTQWIDAHLARLRAGYHTSLTLLFKKPVWVMGGFVVLVLLNIGLFKALPSEFVPAEDRGLFLILTEAPEGSSFKYTYDQMTIIEDRLFPLIEAQEIERMLMRVPQDFSTQVYNKGFMNISLTDWHSGRRSSAEIMEDVRQRISDITGVRAYTLVRQPLVGREGKPVQFVIGGGSYQELAEWRDIILEQAQHNPNLIALDYDYKETTPQLRIEINRNRAADLGVSIANINRTLETMLGSRQVTTYIDRDEEYNVILEGETNLHQTPNDLTNIYVRSERSNQLIPIANLVTLQEIADAGELHRYNRTRAITINANLTNNYTVAEALTFLENIVREHIPGSITIDYKGESLKYKESTSSILWIFLLSLLVVFLVMAGQFESYIHPLVIMFTVPIAIAGALFGLLITGQSLNIYSQISLIMLIGLATKNGILIVEFINQLRDQGVTFHAAILEAATIRLRPILMTVLTTAMASVPLILSSGAGTETRFVIGITILSGTLISALFTLYIVPIAYQIIAKNTGSPERVKRQLDKELVPDKAIR